MNSAAGIRRAGLGLFMLAMGWAAGSASAAQIVATVTDDSGRTLANAVVTVTPDDPRQAPVDALAGLATATIDQKDETFVPEVVVIRTGGAVIFRDSDDVRHHVYSFSPIRRFEFVQHPGEVSAPVQFNQPGIAAIGCNIHDFMIAYVYVTNAPQAVVTSQDGRAAFTGLPAGRFAITVWHPRLWPDAPPISQPVTLRGNETMLTLPLRVMPPRPAHSRNQLY